MNSLSALADARVELLKAELAALLHNTGRLTSNFLRAYSKDGKGEGFAWKNICEPARAIAVERGADIITTKQGIDLVVALLERREIWEDRSSSAANLLECFRKELAVPRGEPPSSPKTCREWLQRLSTGVTDDSVIDDIYYAHVIAKMLGNEANATWKLPVMDNKEFAWLLSDTLEILGEKHSFARVLLVMWDDFHRRDKPTDDRLETLQFWLGQSTNIQRYLITAHHAVSSAEKPSTDAEGEQKFNPTWRATVFGERPLKDAFNPAELDEVLGPFLEAASHWCKELHSGTAPDVLIEKRKLRIDEQIKSYLLQGLGETRRPDNDVTLWDYVHSAASLFKSALAKAVLSGEWMATKDIRWRLMDVSFDGIGFWSSAHRAADMLGRREAIEAGLDSVRDLLEVFYPVGNEIYRDRYGSVFIVPDIGDLLTIKDRNEKTLGTLINDCFDKAGLRGELEPQMQLSDPMSMKNIGLDVFLSGRKKPLTARASSVAEWWRPARRPANAEICTVCGVRPVGYPETDLAGERLPHWANAKKAKIRNICRVCLERRGRRAEEWARNLTGPEHKQGGLSQTIWLDEVVDENGVAVLLVGSFRLEGWLSGELMPTIGKSPSFARIQRCWRTASDFWIEVRDRVIPQGLEGMKTFRLGIKPANPDEIARSLGSWHACEIEISGTRLGLCWDPGDGRDDGAKDGNLFRTAGNLRRFARLLRFEKSALSDAEELFRRLKEKIQGSLTIYESGGYQQRERELPVKAEMPEVLRSGTYIPYIPLFVEPSAFMALTPAVSALDLVERIREKYNQEMARVRDRLPLHLGLVFFPGRTPLGAVMKAGARMLKMPGGWERWQVLATPEDPGYRTTFMRDDSTFTHTFPAKMGDVNVDDKWYQRLCIEKPGGGTPVAFQDVAQFENPADAWIQPSRFDFEFLDTTARRFEISYGSDARRRSRPSRPYLLDDLETLDLIWDVMRDLNTSQRYQVIHSIEDAREAWFASDADRGSWNDGVFRKFVEDTLAGSEWRELDWKKLEPALRNEITEAGIRGELADLAEIHMQIAVKD